MKLGFVGYGNMAKAIIGGVVKNGLQTPQSILVYDHLQEKREEAKKNGLQTANDVALLINNVDMLFICVKPKDITNVLSVFKTSSKRNISFVSIAAGVTIRNMEMILGEEAAIVRTMPNTPMLVGSGTTAICRNDQVSDDVYNYVMQIFQSAGTVYELEESQLDDALNLNGSSPAYIFLFAKTAAEYAAETGNIPYSTALSMFCDTLKGAAEMMDKTGKTADELISNVSSPGGTTVAALEAFEKAGLKEDLQAGFAAAVKRAREMAAESCEK